MRLEQLKKEHAPGLLDLVNEDRHYLREWLPWVDKMHSVQDFERYIADCELRTAEGSETGYVIFSGDQQVGRIGIYNIDQQHKNCSLGYWLGNRFQGKGIITNACKQLLELCFRDLGMNRVEIRCGVGNDKSAAIPLRLGFKKEGILRQAECVNSRFIDLEVFALLKEEWG